MSVATSTAIAIGSAGAGLAGSVINRKKAAQGRSVANTSAYDRNDTSTLQFDPGAMSTYERLQPLGEQSLTDYLTDPLKASYFNQQLAGTNRMLAGQADRQKANLGLNMAALGAAPDPMRQAEIANRIGRSSSASQADSFLKLLMKAEDLRRGAATTALNYRPLQTGTNVMGKGTTSGTSDEDGQGGSIWGDLLGAAGAGLGAYGNSQSRGYFGPAGPAPVFTPYEFGQPRRNPWTLG